MCDWIGASLMGCLEREGDIGGRAGDYRWIRLLFCFALFILI